MSDFKPITVKELREILKRFPEDMVVVTDGYKSGFEKILFPEIIEVRHEPENMEFYGEYQIARENDRDTIKVLAIFRNNRTD